MVITSRGIHSKQLSRNRGRLYLGAIVFLAGAAMAFSAGVDKNGVFQLDGNASTDAGVAGEDWQTVNANPYTGSAIARTGVVADDTPGVPDFAFTGGGSKDINPISSWRYGLEVGGPSKTDITNAYAAAYNVSGDLIIYFGADRNANNGAAQLGFWFFVSGVSIGSATSGAFTGSHTVGDVLVLTNYTTGGAVANIEVLVWDPAHATEKGGTLRLLYNSTNATCGNPGVTDACAIANAAPAPLYWPYTPKGGSLGDPAPINAFFEGGVNLSSLFRSAGLGGPCVASFMAETRSSPSVDASLQDLIGPKNFPVCGVKITKACPGVPTILPDGSAFSYTYNGTVTNTGFGTLTNVTVTDTYPATPSSNGTQTPLVNATLDPGASLPYNGTFTSTVNGPLNTVAVQGMSSGGSVTDSTTAQCQLGTVNPRLNVTKACTVDFDASVRPGYVVLRVDFSGTVTNTGNDQLTGITLSDDPAATFSSGGSVASLAPGGSANFAGFYYPGAFGTPDGRMTFTDQVTATASGASLGGTPPSASGSTHCAVCPSGSCSLLRQ